MQYADRIGKALTANVSSLAARSTYVARREYDGPDGECRVYDYLDRVRLIVEDAEANAVRVIRFTNAGIDHGVIACEATFTGVPEADVATFMRGLAR
jgi:hypothetical protein